jgi:predicted transcriptional regulator of viral defense system
VNAANSAAAPTKSQGTMLETLINALGKARKGKSLEQLQGRLGWTNIQLRNAISRAGAKGVVEMVAPGVYRQKV